jgi:hypothetical protein
MAGCSYVDNGRARCEVPGSRRGVWSRWLNALACAAVVFHHHDMTDTPEPPRYRADRYDRANRLSLILAWVGIVAGVVFIVAVVFFSGFFIGRSSSGNFRGGYGMTGPSQTGPYGHMWPGMMGPGGMFGPGGQWPGQQPPTTTAPTAPRP